MNDDELRAIRERRDEWRATNRVYLTPAHLECLADLDALLRALDEARAERTTLLKRLLDTFNQQWIDNDSVPVDSASASGWHSEYQRFLKDLAGWMRKELENGRIPGDGDGTADGDGGE